MGRLLIIFLLLPFGVQAQIQDTLYTASDTLCLDSTLVVPEYDIFEELATPPLSGNGEANLHDTPAINNLLRWHIYETSKRSRSLVTVSNFILSIHTVVTSKS